MLTSAAMLESHLLDYMTLKSMEVHHRMFTFQNVNSTGRKNRVELELTAALISAERTLPTTGQYGTDQI